MLAEPATCSKASSAWDAMTSPKSGPKGNRLDRPCTQGSSEMTPAPEYTVGSSAGTADMAGVALGEAVMEDV